MSDHAAYAADSAAYGGAAYAAQVRPGDLMFTNIVGAAGVLVWFGQKLLMAAKPSEYKIKHVGVVTAAATADKGPTLVQAMPGGAVEIELGPENFTTDYVYVRPDYVAHPNQNLEVAEDARYRIGTPYSFADYVALFGWHVGIRNGLVRRYVRTSRHMICSQLADKVLSDSGFHVFNDGRLPQDVMPAELYRALLAMPGTLVLHAGSVWTKPPSSS
jgi:hypothetical protein